MAFADPSAIVNAIAILKNSKKPLAIIGKGENIS